MAMPTSIKDEGDALLQKARVKGHYRRVGGKKVHVKPHERKGGKKAKPAKAPKEKAARKEDLIDKADVHNLALKLKEAKINRPEIAARIALRYAVSVASARPEWFKEGEAGTED